VLALALGSLGCADRPPAKAAATETGSAPIAAADERAAERERMVQHTIEARGVRDPRVLAAMRRLPRHVFVPAREQARAYSDQPLPIGHDQTISQPYIVAFMSAALELSGDERVLEIGTGSGYQAAVLAELAREVYSIEIVAPLAERARATLAANGYAGVHLRTGDGYRGWPEAAPFDAIILTAAPEEVPEPLLDQLALGGRLIAPIGDAHQELVLYERKPDGLHRQPLMPVRFVPMTGEATGESRNGKPRR